MKALDKLETLLQHTQGDNPADFDYAFNLDYGRRYTDRAPLFKTLRELLDARTDSASQLGATPSVRPPGQRNQRHRLRSSPWLQGSGWHVSTDRGLSCTPQ